MTTTDRQSVTRFYVKRFCAAFPDVDVLPEITEKEIIRSRLGHFFEEPLTNGDSVWFGDGGFDNISSFCMLPGTPYEFLGEYSNVFFALDVARVVPICQNGLDYTACVYIESRGVVDNRDPESAGDGKDILIFHRSGRKLSCSERDSGCFYDGTIRHAFTGDEVIEMTVSSKPGNLLVIPKAGPVLHENRDLEIHGMLDSILAGKASVEDLKKLLFSFPKPDFNYNEFDQEPLEPIAPDPELLTGLLRKAQKDR